MSKKKVAVRRKPVPVYEEPRFSLTMPDVIRRNPLDSFGLLLAMAASGGILFNALMMQESTGFVQHERNAAAAVPEPRPEAGDQAAVANPPAPSSTDMNMLVREVQAELARRGLYTGPADGLFGPKTEAAILDFEVGAGLKPTGRPNPQLLAAMRGANAPATQSSPRIAAVQRILDQQGFGPVKVDGISGEGTRAAIRRFEASRGLPQSGEITPSLLLELSKISDAVFD